MCVQVLIFKWEKNILSALISIIAQHNCYKESYEGKKILSNMVN